MLELFFRKGELLTDFKSECMCMRIYTNAYLSLGFTGGFPGGSDSKESACNAGNGFDPWARKIPQEKGMDTHSSIHAWRIPWT